MPPSGFLFINKPTGPTSHDIVDKVRHITGIRTVGHAGTLDPFASGLLIIGIGREATKRLDSFKVLSKKYLATLRLGATTDTYDKTGRIVKTNFTSQISNLSIEKILKQYIGEVNQVPPMYSAKKIGGKKLYELAREGKTIERKPSRVTIHSIRVIPAQTEIQNNKQKNEKSINIDFWIPNQVRDGNETPNTSDLPTLTLEILCSAGTYIRSLAHDIGTQLGCGAYCEELVRTAIGPYVLDAALILSELHANTWQTFLCTCTKDTIGILKSAPPRTDHIHYGSENRQPAIVDSRSKVLLFGTFDLLHPGHIDFFRQAKQLGSHLTVGVGRDRVVAYIKGKPSRQDEQMRLKQVRACGWVDEALLLPENPDERFVWIKKQMPDIIALGYDQTAFTDSLEKDLALHGIDCRIVRLKPYQPEKYKSSKMK